MYIGDKFIGSVEYWQGQQDRHFFQFGWSVNGGANQYQTLRVVAVLWREAALSPDSLRQILILEDGSQWARMRHPPEMSVYKSAADYEYTDWAFVKPEYHVKPFEVAEDTGGIEVKVALSEDNRPIGFRFMLGNVSIAEVILDDEKNTNTSRELRKEIKKIGDRQIEQIFADGYLVFAAWRNKFDDNGLWDYYQQIKYLFMEYRATRMPEPEPAKPPSPFAGLEIDPLSPDVNVIIIEDALVKSGYNLKWVGENRPDWVVDEDGVFGWFASRASAEFSARQHNRSKNVSSKKTSDKTLNNFGFVELSD